MQSQIFQSSVRKVDAGKPILLNRLGSAVFVKAKRTATGFFTDLEDTMTVLPSILLQQGQ